VYAYAGGNPLRYVDRDGRFAGPIIRVVLRIVIPKILQLLEPPELDLDPDPSSEPDSDSSEDPPDDPSRPVEEPPCPRKGCTCTCRADADDRIPGNINKSTGAAKFAIATVTAKNCVKASKAAKKEAKQKLGMQPKHTKCRCSGK
jgi:hypothetical protein